MPHITTYTYVYYKKRTLLLMAAGCLCFLLIVGWIVYEKLHASYMSPEELFIIVCGFPFFGTGLYLFVHMLLHKGPAYIIAPQGITDCKRGFVSWQDIKEIVIQDGTSSSDKSIYIKLQNPERHFGGKAKSFFGTRGIGLTPALMWYEELDEPIPFVQLNKR